MMISREDRLKLADLLDKEGDVGIAVAVRKCAETHAECEVCNGLFDMMWEDE